MENLTFPRRRAAWPQEVRDRDSRDGSAARVGGLGALFERQRRGSRARYRSGAPRSSRQLPGRRLSRGARHRCGPSSASGSASCTGPLGFRRSSALRAEPHCSGEIGERAGLLSPRSGSPAGTTIACAAGSPSRSRMCAGRVIGFGGRAIVAPDQEPKYLNTPGEPRLPQARGLLRLSACPRSPCAASGRAVVVEGYFDLIALHRAGIEEACSPPAAPRSPLEHGRNLRRRTRVRWCCSSTATRPARRRSCAPSRCSCPALARFGGWESAFLSHQKGILDTESWAAFDGGLRLLVAGSGFARFWDEFAGAHAPSFRGYIEREVMVS